MKRFDHSTPSQYRTGITSHDTSDPSESVSNAYASQIWFYIHLASGTLTSITVEALFYDETQGAYCAGARRTLTELPKVVAVALQRRLRSVQDTTMARAINAAATAMAASAGTASFHLRCCHVACGPGTPRSESQRHRKLAERHVRMASPGQRSRQRSRMA